MGLAPTSNEVALSDEAILLDHALKGASGEFCLCEDPNEMKELV